MTFLRPLLPATLALLATTSLVISGGSPFDRTTWLLEVFPVMIGLPILFATRRRFPLTDLLYVLLFLHAIVLIVGGTYSYARVPLGDWMGSWLDLNRNPYDKVGHFFQGFVPAMLAREIVLRGAYVRRGKMLVFLVICVVLAISACYELIEWMSAIILGQGADEFLGTQGDPWDTQSDMLFALIGGSTALISLSRIHDRQIAQLFTKLPNADHHAVR